MPTHLINGEFQSDKYPTTPRGKVPLSVKDVTAQDLLWEYAQRHRTVDAEFSNDLKKALRIAGYAPLPHDEEDRTDSIRYSLLDALDQQIARCEGGNVPIRSLPDETVAEAFLHSLAARGWTVKPP